MSFEFVGEVLHNTHRSATDKEMAMVSTFTLLTIMYESGIHDAIQRKNVTAIYEQLLKKNKSYDLLLEAYKTLKMERTA
jgi:hypothetical protein